MNGIINRTKAAASRAGNARVASRTRPTSLVRAVSRVDKAASAKAANEAIDALLGGAGSSNAY